MTNPNVKPSQIARPASNAPHFHPVAIDSNQDITHTTYNRIYLSLKSQHTIFKTLLEILNKYNQTEDLNDKDHETLNKFRKILNVILSSFYGNLFQVNFAASNMIEEIINPFKNSQETLPNELSLKLEKLGFKILSACISIKRIISILSFTNYINATLCLAKFKKGKNATIPTELSNHINESDVNLIKAEDSYQFDTFDLTSTKSNLQDQYSYPLKPTTHKHHQQASTQKSLSIQSESQEACSSPIVHDNAFFKLIDDSTVLDSESSNYDDDYYDEDYDETHEPTVICRICEKEVPLSMIETHSKSCVIAYESSKTVKSTDDHMKKLQAFSQQTVLHTEWPGQEKFVKSVVIPILHVVALLDRAISVDLNSSAASDELALIMYCMNSITITKPTGSTFEKKLSIQFDTSPMIINESSKIQHTEPKNQSFIPMKMNKRKRIGTIQIIPNFTENQQENEDESPFLESKLDTYFDAVSILQRAQQLVSEKSAASSSLLGVMDVFNLTTNTNSDVSMLIEREVTIADFSFIRRISSGAYAKVYLTRKTQTGDLSATKVIHRDSLRQKNDLQRVMVEKNILAEVSNQFMIRFFFSIIGKNNLYLVMEYCPGGDLYSVLQNLGQLEEDKTKLYTAEIVEALEFLRQKNVIHRDLKPDNILVCANGHLKLADFGMSAFGIFDRSVNTIESLDNDDLTDQLNTNQPTQERSRRNTKNGSSSSVSLPGTPDYIAPEIILQQPHTYTADYWSLGCIIYEMLTGIPPFHGDTPDSTFANVLKGVYDESELIELEISKSGIDLIKKLLCRDPKKRLGCNSIDEIKNHPWFTESQIDFNNLLNMEPPFVPELSNEEDTSYFEERYELTNDDEQDIRDDIEEAKLAKRNKAEKKSQSFFSESDSSNLFQESQLSDSSSKLSTGLTPISLAKPEKVGNYKSENNLSAFPSIANQQSSLNNIQSIALINSKNKAATSSGNFKGFPDDELTYFPSASSDSLNTLTFEDTQKKIRNIVMNNLTDDDSEFDSLPTSRSSHNFRRFIMREKKKAGVLNAASCDFGKHVRHISSGGNSHVFSNVVNDNTHDDDEIIDCANFPESRSFSSLSSSNMSSRSHRHGRKSRRSFDNQNLVPPDLIQSKESSSLIAEIDEQKNKDEKKSANNDVLLDKHPLTRFIKSDSSDSESD